jgi:hypothetical protein
MKQLTKKQLLALESQIAILATKLEKICIKNKIGDRVTQLSDERWYDYDAETQEGMVNALHNADHALSQVSYLLDLLRNKQGA